MKNKNGYSEKKTRKNQHRQHAPPSRAQSYITPDRQSLVIYGSNFLGGFVPDLGSYFNKGLFNPIGAVVFGGINIAKRIHDKVDNSYVRLVELVGATYYTASAVSNFLSILDGKADGLGKGFFDSLMAYQLLKNEGVWNNLTTGRTKDDVKKVIAGITNTKSDLETRIGPKNKHSSKDDDYWGYK